MKSVNVCWVSVYICTPGLLLLLLWNESVRCNRNWSHKHQINCTFSMIFFSRVAFLKTFRFFPFSKTKNKLKIKLFLFLFPFVFFHSQVIGHFYSLLFFLSLSSLFSFSWFRVFFFYTLLCCRLNFCFLFRYFGTTKQPAYKINTTKILDNEY